MDAAALRQRAAELRSRYDTLTARRLALDMTRGKPCPEQLDLSLGMLELRDYRADDGSDCRNYGGLEGLPEARRLFAELLDVEPTEVIVGGNSSLALMHDTIVQALLKGAAGCAAMAVAAGGQVSLSEPRLRPPFRHLRALRHRDDAGRDARRRSGHGRGRAPGRCRSRGEGHLVRAALQQPDRRSTYADAVVERFARMETAAPDFRIFWDNAYAVHHLVEPPAPLKSILTACRAAGHADRPYIFTSTSKISFAGGGISAIGRQHRQRPPPDRRIVDPDHRPRQAEPVAPRAVLQGRRRRRRAHAQARGHPQAQVRRGRRDPRARARRHRRRRNGHARRAATSSASTRSTAARRRSSRWPTRPASS